jgi:hypothetical protein
MTRSRMQKQKLSGTTPSNAKRLKEPQATLGETRIDANVSKKRKRPVQTILFDLPSKILLRIDLHLFVGVNREQNDLRKSECAHEQKMHREVVGKLTPVEMVNRYGKQGCRGYLRKKIACAIKKVDKNPINFWKMPRFHDLWCVAIRSMRFDGSFWTVASNRLQQKESAVLRLLSLNGRNLRYLPCPLQCKKEYVLAAVTQNGKALELVDCDELAFDPNVVIAAVTQNGKALEYAKEFRDDPDITKLAVTQDGLALEFADWELTHDKVIVLAAIAQTPSAVQWAAPALREDYETMLAAVERDGLTLKYAASKLQDNHKLARAAVRQNPLALRSVSPRLHQLRAFERSLLE